MRDFNNLSPAELERISILSEEAGEIVHVIGKILRHGYERCHPDGGANNRRLLEKEIGDLRASVELMSRAGDLNEMEIRSAMMDKLGRIGQYLHHQTNRRMVIP